MNTLNLSTLRVFKHFFPTGKVQFLKTCPEVFIPFLSECIVKSSKIAGNKKNHVLKNRNKIHELILRGTTWEQKRRVLSSQKGLLLIKTISPFVINHLTQNRTFCSGTPSCLQQQQPNHC